MPGPIAFIGNAEPTTHIDTITIGGTPAAADTFTITGLSKTVVVTVGTAAATTDVATAIAAAWNSTAMTALYSVAPVGGGQSIPEFSELSAVASGSVVTLTGDTKGRPMPVFTVSKTGAGTIAISHVVVGTGPNDVANTANYSTGALPGAGDDLTIDRPVSLLYNLDALSAVTLASLTIGPAVDITTFIGLKSRNPIGYEEWRVTEFTVGATVITSRSTSGLIKINVGSVQTTCSVYSGNSAQEANKQPFQLRGTHASNLVAVLGSSAAVGFAENGETATLLTANQTLGYLKVGTAVTHGTLSKSGGTADCWSPITTVTNVGALNLWVGNTTTLTQNGGVLTYGGTGTIGTTTINNGATVSVDGTIGSCTFTNTTINVGGSLLNTSKRITHTNPIVYQGRLTATAT